MKAITQLGLVLIFLVQSYSLYSQNEYTIVVDTISYSSSKDFFTEFRDDLLLSHVKIEENNTFNFRSTERYDRDFLNSVTNPLGSEIIEFRKVFVSEENDQTLKNGGQNCWDAALICNNSSFSGNASGFGTQELDGSNRGCLAGNENESSWYYLYVGTNGTLEMEVNPDVNDDYDWAIWGPFNTTNVNTNCPPTSSPTRCSFALPPCNATSWGFCVGYDYTTGMGNGATDNSEGSGGNGWVSPLNVAQDEIYIMLIDNYSTSSDPFDLTWGGTAGLDCTTVPLPVELISFEGQNKGVINELSWETASEKNNDYFTLQYSSDGIDWKDIEKINGAGTTSSIQYYSATHRDFEIGINYYRLTQVDFDGARKTHKIKSIDNSSNKKLLKRINTIGKEVPESYKGLVILYYSDGSIKKILQ